MPQLSSVLVVVPALLLGSAYACKENSDCPGGANGPGFCAGGNIFSSGSCVDGGGCDKNDQCEKSNGWKPESKKKRRFSEWLMGGTREGFCQDGGITNIAKCVQAIPDGEEALPAESEADKGCGNEFCYDKASCASGREVCGICGAGRVVPHGHGCSKDSDCESNWCEGSDSWFGSRRRCH